MTSLLQRQVTQHKKQFVATQSIKDGKPSIFLSAREAAGVDVTKVHEAALTGLKALTQYDDRFLPYFETLLHPSSIDLQRELKTKEENEKLNIEIDKLLNLLSLWAFEPNAHLVLEYLIRRYAIHQYNTDMLIRCMLIAHDTMIFVKVIQLCTLENTIWEFLLGVKEAGVPLSRPILVKQMIKHSILVEILTEITLNALTLSGVRDKHPSQSSIKAMVFQQSIEQYLSFYMALIIEMAEQIAFDDQKLRHIYLFLLLGIKTKCSSHCLPEKTMLLINIQWKNTCLIILSQIGRKTMLNSKLLRTLSDAFAMFFDDLKVAEELLAQVSWDTSLITSNLLNIQQNTYKTMSILAEHNQLIFTPKLIHGLFAVLTPSNDNNSDSHEDDYEPEAYETSSFLSIMELVSQSTNLTAFYCSLIQDLTGLILKYFTGLLTNQSDINPEYSLLTGNDYCYIINQLIIAKQIPAIVVQDMFTQLLTQLPAIEGVTTIESYQQINIQGIAQLCQSISHHLPRIFELVLSSQLTNSVENTLFKDFLTLILTPHTPPTTSFTKSTKQSSAKSSTKASSTTLIDYQLQNHQLYFLLNHPIKRLRIQALKEFEELIIQPEEYETEQTIELTEAIVRNMQDYDGEIALHCWTPKILSHVLQCIAAERIWSLFVQSLMTWYTFSKRYTMSSNTDKTESNNNMYEEIIYQMLSCLQGMMAKQIEAYPSYMYSIYVILFGLFTHEHQLNNNTKKISPHLTIIIDVLLSFPLLSSTLCQSLTVKDMGDRTAVYEHLINNLSPSSSNNKTDKRTKKRSDSESQLATTTPLTNATGLLLQTLANIAMKAFKPIDDNQDTDISDEIYLGYQLVSLDFLYFLMTLTQSQANHNEQQTLICRSINDKMILPYLLMLLSSDFFTRTISLSCMDNFLTMVESFFKQSYAAKTSASVAESKKSLMETFILQITTSSTANDQQNTNQEIEYQLLQRILANGSPRILSLMGVMFQYVFVQSPCQILLRLIVSTSGTQRLLALHSLHYYLQQAIETKTFSMDTKLTLAFLPALILWVLEQSTNEERQIGLSLLTLLQQLSKSTYEQLQQTICQDLPSYEHLHYVFTEVIVNHSNVIALQTNVLSTFLRTLKDAHNTHAAFLQWSQYLIHIMTSFGWKSVDIPLYLLQLSISCDLTLSTSYFFSLLQDLSSLAVPLTSNPQETYFTKFLEALTYYVKQLDGKKDVMILIKYLLQDCLSSKDIHSSRLIDIQLLLIHLFNDEKIVHSFTADLRELIYQFLLQEHVTRSNNTAILSALSKLMIQPTIVLNKLTKEVQELPQETAPSTEVTSANKTGMDEEKDGEEVDEENQMITGLAQRVQYIASLAESSVAALLTSTPHLEILQYNQLIDLLFLIFSFLQSSMVKYVLSLEYYKGIVLDATCQVFQYLVRHQLFEQFKETLSVTNINPTTHKKGAKATVVYPFTRESIQRTIHILLQCIATAQRHSILLTSILSILNDLINCTPEILPQLLTLLQQFLLQQLSMNALTWTIKEKQLSSILTFVWQKVTSTSTAITPTLTDNEQMLIHQQRFLQQITQAMNTSLSSSQRLAMSRSIFKIIGNQSHCTAVYLTSLLSQSIVAHEMHGLKQQELLDVAGIDQILLTRSSARRAQRMVTHSLSEELFQLTTQSFLEFTPLQQQHNLVAMLHWLLLEIEQLRQKQSSSLIDLSVGSLSSQLSSVNNNSASQGGLLATMILIQLEFVYHLFENSTFHNHQIELITPVTNNNANNNHKHMQLAKESQARYLEIIDLLLQIVAETEQLPNKLRNQTISIYIEGSVKDIVLSSMFESIQQWTLNLVGSFQRLLDVASFVSIIQEIITHPMLIVRQKAILLLKDRLTDFLSLSSQEMILYLDLRQRMQTIVKEYMQQYILPTTSLKKTTVTQSLPGDSKEQIAFTQSALLCLDVLCQYTSSISSSTTTSSSSSSNTQKKDDLQQLLNELLTYIQPLYQQSINNEHPLVGSHKMMEHKKLLASLLLCVAGLIKVLGVQTIALLPEMIGHITTLFEKELQAWKQYFLAVQQQQVTAETSTEKVTLITDLRGHVLFFRALITSLTIFIPSVSHFLHRYLPNLFTLIFDSFAIFPSQEVMYQGFFNDLEQCLMTIRQHVPIRLLLPHLSQDLARYLGSGSIPSAIRLTSFVRDIANQLDRKELLSSLTKWLQISLDLLEYRMKYHLYVDMSATMPSLPYPVFKEQIQDMETLVNEFILEITMKLTEKELKVFMLKIIEWKNLSESNPPKKAAASSATTLLFTRETLTRQKIFYQLLAQMIEQLKTLSFMIMYLCWDDYIVCFSQLSSYYGNFFGVIANQMQATMNKKRQRDDEQGNGLFLQENIQSKIFFVPQTSVQQREAYTITYDYDLLMSLQQLMIRIISQLCQESTMEQVFLNEKYYETVYPLLIQQIHYRYLFSSDDRYLQFISTQLLPTFVLLCNLMNKDVLWKPLNHKLLLLTRSSMAIIRRASIALIGKLFEEVGEEYLLLLPECLPYISELLEDTHAEVLTATRETIAVIEDLSGEKLDSYLQ